MIVEHENNSNGHFQSVDHRVKSRKGHRNTLHPTMSHKEIHCLKAALPRQRTIKERSHSKHEMRLESCSVVKMVGKKASRKDTSQPRVLKKRKETFLSSDEESGQDFLSSDEEPEEYFIEEKTLHERRRQ